MNKHFRLITLALIGAVTLFVSCQNPNGGDTTPTAYTVTFDSNGGSSVASQTVDSNSKATKPTDPTKDTYSFAGWTKDGAAYDFTMPVTSNITLTASWTKNTYTVTFDVNGGTSTISAQTVSGGSTASKPVDPTREDYSFTEWTNDGVSYDFATPVTSSFTLTATWSALPVYTVTFDSNGGSAVSSQSVIQGKLASEPSSTYAPHNFLGWYNGATKYEFTTPVTSNVTLTAKWTTTVTIEDEVRYDSQNANGSLTFTASLTLSADKTFESKYHHDKATTTILTAKGTYAVNGNVYTLTFANNTSCSYTESNGSWTLTPTTSTVSLPGFGNNTVAITPVTRTVTASHNVEVE